MKTYIAYKSKNNMMISQDNKYDTGVGWIPHPLSIRGDILMLGPLDDPYFLLLCYRYGVFPWYESGDLGVFFYPSERFIIEPDKVKIAKSMRPYFNQQKYTLTIDQSFDEVIQLCKNVPRGKDNESWISDKFVSLYKKLHYMGYAHSFETRDKEGKLVGGLYGLGVGKVFHGESMFALEKNASKFCFISMCKILEVNNFDMIDCQVENNYLRTFGGESISRKNFYHRLRKNLLNDSIVGNWNELPRQI
jgi:leucyl/phenylalanyl-tRNA--protein transferase